MKALLPQPGGFASGARVEWIDWRTGTSLSLWAEANASASPGWRRWAIRRCAPDPLIPGSGRQVVVTRSGRGDPRERERARRRPRLTPRPPRNEVIRAPRPGVDVV